MWKIHSKLTTCVKAVFETLSVTIMKLKAVLITVFLSCTIASIAIVLYKPKLQLPDSGEHQFFYKEHLLESYDLHYKKMFAFEIEKYADEDFNMPIRVIFGVLPIDNGNSLSPYSRGSLHLDEKFDIANRKSQAWLLEFCQQLRNQSFYKSTVGPLLSNCFIETFKSWMDDRPCKDILTNTDQSPCCRTSKFPYSKNVFYYCIRQAVELLHKTPRFLGRSWAGPRFDLKTQQIAAVVIEYESSHKYSTSFFDMKHFWNTVNFWVMSKLETAPNSMQRGWFISDDLEFFALQDALAFGTIVSIFVAIFFAFVVIFLTTLDFIASIVTGLTILSTVFGTLATLVLLKWKLNVLESVIISLTIGLCVDFPLHYTIAYKISKKVSI